MYCRYIYINCLWCLLWIMCDAYHVYLSGVRYTWPNNKNREYMVSLPSGLLPSARVKTLGKANTWQISVHSETKMTSLPSVYAVTLGKEANICTFWASLCRVSSIWHSTKKTGLPSAPDLTLGKEGMVTECQILDTWQRSQHLYVLC